MSFARARAAVLSLFALAALGAAAYWVRLGVPVPMDSAPSGRIACVSYAPYRKAGESPFVRGYVVDPARIDEDLKALSRRFDCVRTYSVGQGLDQVPAIARRYGMKVLLGAWLSRNAADNDEELALVEQVANRERDVVRAIVVGNEVLLRGELPQRTVAAHVRAVKAATGLPVTYADVWEFWLKYPEVAPAVDFITIHILPYWEDEPVAVGGAIAHVEEIYARMQAAFPGRDFLIGETGWPSAGRQRWRAMPSRVNEARFFREFMTFVEASRLPYNVIEAFDQPWKRTLEGTVGGYWGLYDDALRDKFALAGPVVEEPGWWIGILCGLAGAGFAALAVRLARPPRSRAATALAALAGFFVAAVAAAEARHLVFANRDRDEWIVTVVASLVAVVTALVVVRRLATWMAGPADARIDVAPMSRLRSRADADLFPRAAGVLQAFWLVAATVVDLLLAYDSRYRDFPSLLFAVPVVAFAALALARSAATPETGPDAREIEERMLAGALVAGAAAIVAMELPINGSADFWALLNVAFAAATWINGARAAADRRVDRAVVAPTPAHPP